MTRTMTTCLTALLGAAALAAEPGALPARAKAQFAEKPAVTRQGGKWTITFQAKSPCDVAVSIVGADETIVRHLAAGVLGLNPPEPLKKDSMAQSLEWDGTDDDGKPVPKGAYRVRVQLGLKPALDGFIGAPQQFAGGAGSAVLSTCCDRRGHFYVLRDDRTGTHGRGGESLVCFDRDGNYVRTILPFPANLPLEDVAGAEAFLRPGDPHYQDRDRKNVVFPRLTGYEYPTTVPALVNSGFHGMAVSPDGTFLVLSGGGGPSYRVPGAGRAALKIGTDGSVRKNFTDITIPVAGKGGIGAVGYAVTSDGTQVYAVTGRVVYRTKTGVENTAELFAELQSAPAPARRTSYRNPGPAIACDDKGRVYVADQPNGCIWVFDSTGKSIGRITVNQPRGLAVHPSGAPIYVFAPAGKGARLVKLSGVEGSGKELGELTWSGDRKDRIDPWASLAGDFSAEPTVLWVGTCNVVDKGDAFESRGEVIAAKMRKLTKGSQEKIPAGKWGFGGMRPRFLTIHRPTETLYTEYGACSGKTGEFIGAGYWTAPDPATPTLDGRHVLTQNYRHRRTPKPAYISRYKLDGTRVRFPAFDAKDWRPSLAGFSAWSQGVFQAPSGDIYFRYSRPNAILSRVFAGAPGHIWSEIGVIGADGALKKKGLVSIDGSVSCVKVDRKGCVYVGAGAKPLNMDEFVPAGFPVPKPQGRSKRLNPTDLMLAFWGTVFKFRPEGGSVKHVADPEAADVRIGFPIAVEHVKERLAESHKKSKKGKPEVSLEDASRLADEHFGHVSLKEPVFSGLKFDGSHYRPHFPPAPARVKGAEWWFYGFGPMPDSFISACTCEHGLFDLDDFGRLYLPDPLRFCVTVIDNNANVIIRFGSYGNFDSQGPGSAVPVPAIPLGYPTSAAASDTHCYVTDHASSRIVRVKLSYDVQHEVPIQR